MQFTGEPVCIACNQFAAYSAQLIEKFFAVEFAVCRCHVIDLMGLMRVLAADLYCYGFLLGINQELDISRIIQHVQRLLVYTDPSLFQIQRYGRDLSLLHNRSPFPFLLLRG